MVSSPLTAADRRWLQATAAGLSATAAGALIGRALGNEVLVKWVPGESGMVFSAAAAMVIVAIGLLAIATGRRAIVLLAGAAVLSLGTLELLVRLVAEPAVHPTLHGLAPWVSLANQIGKMAPDTAVGLVLVGLVFLLRGLSSQLRNVIAAVSGVIGALAFLPLLQLAAWIMTSGSEEGHHGMAVPTSFCFIVFAIAMVRVERTPSEGALSFMSAAIGVMFSIGIGAVRANADLRVATREVVRTYEVRAAVSAMVEQVARAESSARGYALTGESYFRDRVNVHQQEAERLIADVEKWVADEPDQLARAREVRRRSNEKSEQNARLLATRESGGAAAAAQYLSSILAIPGQPSSNLVVLAAQIEAEEQKLLAFRTERQAVLEQSTRMVQVAGTLIAAALLVSAILFTRRAGAARRAAEAQFRRAFEDAGIGMALVGLDGSWLRLNPALLELLGYPHEELTKRTFQDITHPDDLAADLTLVRDLIAGRARTYQLEKRYFHSDGHVVWGNLTVSIVRESDGTPLHFVAQVEDITARKRLESELRAARDEALAAARLKSEFLATMSHEIRTPLNGVLGMTHLLLDSPLNSEQQEMARTVENCGENLLRVLNDILDFSTMEAGKLSLVPSWFSVEALVAEAAALYSPQAQSRGVAVRSVLAAEIAGQFWGDSGRIKQVLDNLVGNAVKFTEHGQVTIAAGVARETESGAMVRISVTDTGIGIAPADQSRLFQTFSQVDGSDRRKYGGTGLGLAICKRIVEQMGGEIGLNSRPGEGSTFWFQLPFGRGAAPAPQLDAPAAPTALLGARVLVAEDNLPGQLVAKMTLTQMGYIVDVVSSGEAVFAQLGRLRYSAVLMDCQMPGLDGFETTRRIRHGEIAGVDPAIPIIALTAAAFPEDRERCLAAGMNDYLTKPLVAADLGAALTRVGVATYLPAAG